MPRTRNQVVKDFLQQRKIAFGQVFHPDNPYAQQVLADLARFCRAHESCFNSDPRIHAALEGRREVWLRIQNHLSLTPDQLCVLYNPGATVVAPSTGDK